MNIKHFYFFSLVLICGNSVTAQTGPGGVGNSTSNRIWFKADANVYKDAGTTLAVDGDLVQQWNDRSGNANNASQGTSGNRPKYASNVINGKPALRFTGNTFIDPGALGIPGTGGFTYIIVFKDTTYVAGVITDGAGDYLIDRTTATNELAGLKICNTDKYAYQKRDNAGAGLGGPISTTAVNTAAFHVIDYMRERGTAYRLFLNGTLETSIADADGDITPPVPRIGRHATTAGNGLKGYIAELLIYNYRVNNAQINILNSYLAAKYGLTIANDKFSYDAVHGNDVAGIGRVDAGNTHTDAQSGSILEINSASSLGDGDYLLFGHDNASISSWTTTEAPNAGTDIKRLTREWRLNETDGGGGDGVGTMKFIIDNTSLPALTATYTKYVLMVDADGDFSSGASVYEMDSPGSNNYFETLSAIDISNGDYVAIGEVRPTIQFSADTSSGFETGNASLAVTLNYIAKTAVNVTYNTANGTAIAPGDYTAVAGGTHTIPAGSSSANITITVVNDVAVEIDETLTVTLSAPTGGVNLGTQTIHTYTIHDDDNTRKIYFTSASSSGNENVTPVNLTISIDVAQIDAVNPTTVDYYVSGGTATGSGTDFTLLGTGTATIAANAQTTSISFTVNDDALYESSETIIISLTNPVNCNLSGVNPILYTYTIIDNDSPPVIQFTAISSSGSESVTSVNVQVSQNVVSGLASTVAYTLAGTATGSGTDYTLVNGTLTIPAGSTSANITATIINDGAVEFSETIIITLSAPVNSTLGANTVHTYTIIDNDIFGYKGPGGVGDLNTNKFWIKADANAYSDAGTTLAVDGVTVQQWNDQSGNGNNATQGVAGNRPIYKTNIVNSKPALNFTGNTFIDGGALGIAGTGGFTYFIVVEATSYTAGSVADGAGDYIIDRTTATNELTSLKAASTSKFGFQKRDNSGAGLGGPVTTTSINTSAFQLINYTRERGSLFKIFQNGTMENSVADAEGDLTPPAPRIGRHSSTASAGLKGYISELAVYNTSLNTAQRIIVENYLASKYGLSIPGASDKFAHDVSYGNDVAGIGMEDASNYHTDARGASLVRINTASSMNPGDYLLWGHDNANFNYNTTDVPAGVNNRMERIWRADETGNIGTVSLHFDLTSSVIGNSNDLVLLIDSDDGVFINSTQISLSSFAVGIATFDNIDFADGDWFTIASLSPANPLPVQLLSFDAKPNGKSVDVTWTTSSEFNSDYFIVQHSKNGNVFEDISQIDAVGNSSIVKNYSSVDNEPYSGVSFYRLKQVDNDGKFTYSALISIDFQVEGMEIYPNPVIGSININLKANIGDEVLIMVRDVLGREFYCKVITVLLENEVIVVDPEGKLASGVYLVVATYNGKIYEKKIVVK